MARLLLISSYFPLDDASDPPLALSCASPSARLAVECSCLDGYTSSHLSIRLCHQPFFRRPVVGFTKLHGTTAQSPWPLLFGSATPVPAPLRESTFGTMGKSTADTREESHPSTTNRAEGEARSTGAVAALAPFLCGGPDSAGQAMMQVKKQDYALQLPRVEIPALYTRTVRVDGTKLPRALHVAMWWLRRNASVPLVLSSPFMRGRLSVYPLLREDEMEALSLPEFADDVSQRHLLAHNAELRARFVEFAGPALPFLLDVNLPECDRVIDLTPLSGAVNMICFSVSGNGVFGVDFLRDCERLEYVKVSRCPHLTNLAALTATEAKAQRLSALLAAATGVVDTAHFLSARCTALAHLDLSRCTQLHEFASIGTLPSLRQLSLSHTAVPSIEWIGGCAQLEELHVVECTQLTDLSPLTGTKYLDTLNASESGVRGLEWLATHCRFLYRLHLDNCKSVTDWTPLGEAIGSGSLGHLSVAGCGPFSDLSWLRSPYTQRAEEGFRYRLRVLNVSNCDQLSDARALKGATALTSLNISATAIRDLSWLPTCTALEDLNMSKCPHVRDYNPVYAVTVHLLSLNLSWCSVSNPRTELIANPPAYHDLSNAPTEQGTEQGTGSDYESPTAPALGLYQLLELDLSNCKKLTSLAAMTAATGSTLRRLTVAASSVDTLAWLSSCTALRVLHAPHCNRLPQDAPLDLSPLLRSAQTLVELNFSYTIAVSDITVLRACTALERLSLANCTKLVDLEPLRRLGRLELVNLAGCVAVTSIDALRGCTRLKQLNISLCTGIADFSAIGHLPDLRRLDASATGLDTVAWIRRCRGLEEVNVARCRQLMDVGDLRYLPNLARLNMAHTGALKAHTRVPTTPLAPRSGGDGGPHSVPRAGSSGRGAVSSGACQVM